MLMNSRSRSDRAIDRTVRAFQAQPKTTRIRPTVTNDVLPRTSALSTMRIGNTGIVMKVSVKVIAMRSYQPPM